jgi:beta-aspartyl-peptidase (threonine type)
VDADGHVATATSTGGIVHKRPGRIGDTPLCGCGTYADDRAGAASATGDGESIIRATMTRVCADAMRRGSSASEAAWASMDDFEESVPGTAGIVCCDAQGRVGAAHNTPRMAWGAGEVGGKVVAGTALERGADIMRLLE